MSGNWRNVFLRRYKTWRFRPGFFTTEAIRSSVLSSNRKVFHRATDSPRHDALPPRCCVLCRHGNVVSALRSGEWHSLCPVDRHSMLRRPLRCRRTRPLKPVRATRTTCVEPSLDRVSRLTIASHRDLLTAANRYILRRRPRCVRQDQRRQRPRRGHQPPGIRQLPGAHGEPEPESDLQEEGQGHL